MKLNLLFVCIVSLFIINDTNGEVQQPKSPYSFGYDAYDEYGTKQHRLESSDETGVVKGSYSYMDAQGIGRLVNYVADDNGYRASISSNEPGVQSHNPASAVFHSLSANDAHYDSQTNNGHVPLKDNTAASGSSGNYQDFINNKSPYVYTYRKLRK